jgi:hypothetical protein
MTDVVYQFQEQTKSPLKKKKNIIMKKFLHQSLALVMTTATLFPSCESIKIQIKRKRGAAIGSCWRSHFGWYSR